MKILCIIMLFLLLQVQAHSQISKIHEKNKPFYDYFIFGVTDAKIKNIKELAQKYNLNEKDIYFYNNMYKNLDNIKINKRDTLFLPPFTFEPINLDFDNYFKEFYIEKKDTLYLNEINSYNKKYRAINPIYIKEMNKICKYYKNLYFFEIPEISIKIDSIIPLGKITIAPDFKLYLIEAINFNFAYRNKYIYILKQNKLVSLPIIVHFQSSQYTENIYSKIFYYNDQLVILQTLEDIGHGDYHYKKVSLYSFSDFDIKRYNIWEFKEANNLLLYEFFENKMPFYRKLLEKISIIDKK